RAWRRDAGVGIEQRKITESHGAAIRRRAVRDVAVLAEFGFAPGALEDRRRVDRVVDGYRGNDARGPLEDRIVEARDAAGRCLDRRQLTGVFRRQAQPGPRLIV